MLRIIHCVACCAHFLGLGACSTLPTGNGSEIRIGITAVNKSETSGSQQTADSTFGGWIGQNGIGIGYKSQRRVAISEDCKVVFLVDDAVEIETARDLIASSLDIHGSDICIEESISD